MPTVSVEHIELDEHGVARVAGTRSRVIGVALDARNGMTPAQIHEQYPHLSMSQIHAALACYYDHQSELDAAIGHELRKVQAFREENDPAPSRASLEARIAGDAIYSPLR